MIVTGVLILFAVLGVFYVVLNVRRLVLGRRWAFTICQVAKEWDARERAKRVPARAVRSARTASPPPSTGGPGRTPRRS